MKTVAAFLLLGRFVRGVQPAIDTNIDANGPRGVQQ